MTAATAAGGTAAPRSIPRPAPRASTMVSAAVVLIVLGMGVWSFIGLDYSPKAIDDTAKNVSRFFSLATPVQWPGFEVTGVRGGDGVTTFETRWVGLEPIGHMIVTILTTLALVVAGTALAAALSVPVAYGAARNTTPHPVVMVVCRGIGVLARAVPDVVIVVFFAYLWFQSGALPAVVAIGLHSIGMISKMFADAIEQIDEGPPLAIRSAGGTKAQEFWTAVVPQALPAWIAVTLHRADINLRGTVILGVVGVAGIGYELHEAIHSGPAGMRRVIPLVVIIIALCVVFEVVSSLLRARLMGGQAGRAGRARSASSTALPADPQQRIAHAMRRPWDDARRGSLLWTVSGWVIVGGSFLYLLLVVGLDVTKMFAPAWERVGEVWPLSLGSRSEADVVKEVIVTVQVAFASTLLATILSAFVGPLSARNVAPTPAVRNLFRGIALVVRAIPDLVVAILFIIMVGLGPQAGTLALGIGGVGLLAKLIGDSMEEVPNGPERALAAAGGTRSQVFFSSTVPLSMPALIGHLMYLLDHNIRSATLLGIVGAGGIGFLLLNALQAGHFDQVLTYLLIIVVMVVIVEGASVLIRRTLR